MHAFKIFGPVALFALSVIAQKSSATPASEMPVVTMMWGDSKPTNAALAASAESVGMVMSSQIATAAAEMSMSGSMSGMSMATATTKASGTSSAKTSGMSGMSMSTASSTANESMSGMMMGGAEREVAWGMGIAMALMGVGAALVV